MCAQGAALNSLFLQVFLYFSPLTFEGSSRETAKKFRLLFRCDGLSVYSAYGMCVLCIVGCRSSALNLSVPSSAEGLDQTNRFGLV